MRKTADFPDNFSRFVFKSFLLLILSSTPSLGSAVPEDSLVIVGVGNSGSWATEFTVANASGSQLAWELSRFPTFEHGCIPEQCHFILGSLRVAETQTVLSVPRSLTQDRVTTLYVTPENGPATALTVRARVVNSSRPTQAIEVPAFRLSTIVALNPTVLVFPGAKRTADSRTNLVLSNIIRPSQLARNIALTIEAYSGDGRLIGSQTVVLGLEETRFLVDVLAELGVTTLDVGQIRVTKVAGDGVFWGAMFTTTSDGGVSVSVGAHP